MSTFRVEVVPVSLEPHPNADSLSLVRVFDNYVVAVRTEDWAGRKIGAYIPPDSVVPETEQFAFLAGHTRIKAKKLRGVVSQGLLTPAPDGVAIGDDVAELLGVTHYEPPVTYEMGDKVGNPPIPGEKYDIESWFKYGTLIPDGTEVEITEKIHGANLRVTFQDGTLYAGSRTYYRQESASCLYWQAVYDNPWLRPLTETHPGLVFYGEVFGWVQDLRYGATNKSQKMVRMFDVFDGSKYLSTDERLSLPGIAAVPLLYRGPYSADVVREHIDGRSTLADHVREGIVIKPTAEMWNQEIGRVILKAVSPAYLERA